MKLPELSIDPTLEAVDAALVAAQDNEARPYFGVSTAGYECARRRWLQWRWAGREQMSAQSIKAIEDGHRGEALQAERLRLVPGITLQTVDEQGKQFAVAALGHLKGHIDGAIIGLLQAPKTYHVWEHKQVNEKKHALLQKAKEQYGEKDALEHWDHVFFVQAQLYLHYTGMTRHYLTAGTPGGRATISCRTEYQKDKALRFEQQAREVIYAPEPPPKISDDAAYYLCKFCPFHAQCHGEARPAVTCRSCAHSTPTATGEWHCAQFDAPIPEDVQREGCGEHRYIPVLLERVAELQTADGNNLRWKNLLTGRSFDQPMYSSNDIHDAADFRVIGDDYMQELKTVFGNDTRITSTPVPPESDNVFPQNPADLKAVYGKQSAVRGNAAMRPSRARAA